MHLPGKDAHAITSKYGNFDFPAIPEHDTSAENQAALMATRPPMRPPSGVRPANKFLSSDPNQTTQSIQSVNSVNLERIN